MTTENYVQVIITTFIFRPTIYCVGRENHHLCSVIFPNSVKSPTFLLLHLVCGHFNHHGLVGRASVWQTGGSGFEPEMEPEIFVTEKIPVLSGSFKKTFVKV